nr:hypothetical protein [Nanoarchaeum sp.]
MLGKGNNSTPTNRVLDLKKEGMDDSQIFNRLERERYQPKDIYNAFDQATVKQEIDMNDVPSPSEPLPEPEFQTQAMQPEQMTVQPRMPMFSQEPAGRANYEMIEEIAESVVSEKWDDMIKNIGDLKLWKERVETDMSGVKQEVLRMQARIENLQKAVLGKVSDYNDNIAELSTEVKAMEKVFEKILEPLTRNVKDLEKITEKFKKN